MGNKQSTAKQKDGAPKKRSPRSKTDPGEKKEDMTTTEDIQLEDKAGQKEVEKGSVENGGEQVGEFVRNASGRRSSGRAKASLRKRGIVEISYEDYSYPFENLVFEGGGATCLAYSGSIRVSTDTDFHFIEQKTRLFC